MSDSKQAVTVVKRVKNAVLYSNGHIKLENIVFSHPHVFEKYQGTAKPGDSNTPSFSCIALMPKATHKEAKDLIKEEIARLCRENKVKDVAADRKFITDGDQKAKDETVGMWVVSGRDSKNKPFVRDRAKNVIDSKDSHEIYGGAKGHMIIRPWWCDNQYGKRVASGIIGIQKIADGEPFGDATRITDEDVDNMLDAEDDDGSVDVGDDDDL